MKKDIIFLIEKDPEYINQLTSFLADYEIIHVITEYIFAKKTAAPPDIVLINITGMEDEAAKICAQLRENRAFSSVPILAYGKSGNESARINIFNAGADDFLVCPFSFEELNARITAIIKRFRETRDLNPLSGLPGNNAIREEINKRISAGGKFAVFYIDLDNFKAYNDKYGYEKGDEIIKFLAGVISRVSKEKGYEDDFIGHIGGDDFILITHPDTMEETAQKIITDFENNIAEFYVDKDKEKGYITVKNRRGQVQLFPIMTISVGIAHNLKRRLYNPVQVSEIAAELKEYAKSKRGSNIAVERRSE